MAPLAGLVPVFLVLALGVGARRFGILPEAAAAGLNRLVANVALPAFFVLTVGTAPLGESFSARAVGVTAALVTAATFLALVAARFVRLSREQSGVFAQAAMRGNLAYVALPVVQASVGDGGLRLAAVTAAVLIPLMNVLAVAVLEAERTTGDRDYRLVVRVLANPMVAAALGGLVLSRVGWHPWLWLQRTLEILSDFALPGALLALGAELSFGRFASVWRPAVAVTVVKLCVVPGVGLWAMWALEATPLETSVAVLLLAAPTAVVSYPVAAELGGDIDLAGSAILVTTVASFGTYAVWALALGS
ncbi:MAG: AEC family transporter [Acidobacteriota bacterium]